MRSAETASTLRVRPAVLRCLSCWLLTGTALLLGPLTLHSQATSQPSGPPQAWVQRAADNELAIIQNDGHFPLRYRMRKVDAKGDITRESIESRDGTVARLVEHNGQTLTREEDVAEQQRLNEILSSPADFIKHHKKDAPSRGYALELVKLLPKSMLYSYAAGQPQPPGASSPQVVIDFLPDPGFKPPSMAAELLTGVAGRFWIDQRTGRMSRADVRILHPVNIGWGVLGSIHEGGTVSFEQTQVGDDRWAYSRLDEQITVRVLFSTREEKTRIASWNFRLLPAPVSVQDAVHTLLAMPVPTR